MLVALAVVAGAVGTQALRHHDQCDAAYQRLQRGPERPRSPADALAAANDLVDSCPMTRQTLGAGLQPHPVTATPTGACAVAKRITRDTPDDYLGWLVLLFGGATGRPGGIARGAYAEVVHLVPGYSLH